MGILRILDITTEEANQYVKKWHRHCDPVPKVQVRFAVKLVEINIPFKILRVVGVAIIGNPCGRPHSKNVIEIRRIVFNPEISFGHIRRHYDNTLHNKSHPSRRILPIIVQTKDIHLCYVIEARKVPSEFLKIIEKLIKIRFPNMHTIWTYVHDYEKAIYIEHANYDCDHRFIRRGIAKRRYSRPLTNHPQQISMRF